MGELIDEPLHRLGAMYELQGENRMHGPPSCPRPPSREAARQGELHGLGDPESDDLHWNVDCRFARYENDPVPSPRLDFWEVNDGSSARLL